MVKVFFLGATGHIGGEVLDATLNQFPDIEVTALVRTEDKGARLRKRYRNVKTVIGDLDSLDVIEQASKDVSIVISTSPSTYFIFS
ncbi:hypothetical protein SLS55_004133 [Diplodia seriata]|uniref:Putative nucleoside-diphosphate-sugar epimerase n=1 Tax=Diplodia seriata TaxID=420778 RepID=A0A0G2EJE8_9PEZI|nr:putative nucleoside-diphosphate-sugar epimerase [Diplodia seriata]